MSSADAAVHGVASNGPTVQSSRCAVRVCAGAHEADRTSQALPNRLAGRTTAGMFGRVS